VIPVDADPVGRRCAIGVEVARWRKRRGLTRQQFADLCGRSASWVDKVEAGSRRLTQLPMLELVADVLHVSVDTLTGDARAPGSRDAGASACMDAFEIGSIREALQRYEAISSVFAPVQRDQPPDLDRLEQSVTHAWLSFQSAAYPSLGQSLPRLLRAAQSAASAHGAGDDDGWRARCLLSLTYQVTASALWKVKEIDLAWLAAERGLATAEQTGDSLLISDAARRVSQGLMTLGQHEQALSLLGADIERLEPGRGQGSTAFLSLYGMLFLMGAVVAGRAMRGAVAREFLAEGAGVAGQLGFDGNERYTAFGPTNVALHRVAVLADLGDGGAVVDAAREVLPGDLVLLPRERRANFHIDVARGHALAGRRNEAVTALLNAETLAADEVRCRPVATALIAELQRRPGPRSWPLTELAARAGMPSRG
jgi:transcriptional regulator with XRE-family HTH domain